MRYCSTSELQIVKDINEVAMPVDALTEDHCWKTICRVRGRNVSKVDAHGASSVPNGDISSDGRSRVAFDLDASPRPVDKLRSGQWTRIGLGGRAARGALCLPPRMYHCPAS